MTGEVLFPLNEQPGVLPADVYDYHAGKYDNRLRLRKVRISVLGDCLWNDVIFMMAVNPAEWRRACESVGFSPPPTRYFVFDAETLDRSRLGVMTRMRVHEPREFEPYDPARHADYAVVPPETLEYWRQELQKGAEERPLLWMHIPHILYRGSLDTTGIPIIEA